jgi:hypothetical protein
MTRRQISLLKSMAEHHGDPAVRRAVTAALIELGVPMPPVTLSELERYHEEKHEEWRKFFCTHAHLVGRNRLKCHASLTDSKSVAGNGVLVRVRPGAPLSGYSDPADQFCVNTVSAKPLPSASGSLPSATMARKRRRARDSGGAPCVECRLLHHVVNGLLPLALRTGLAASIGKQIDTR